MYKVFTDKSIVTIKEKSDLSRDNDYLKDVQFVVDQLEKGAEKINLETFDSKKVFDAVFKNYELIEAAGGLVYNDKKDFLVIHRLGKWDLPKGKIEPGESIQTAAQREVEEECGVHNLIIKEKLLDTYHTYTLKGKKVLKKTYWFLMWLEDEQELVPQTEENITEVKWLPWKERKSIYQNTYGNIKEVIASAEEFI